MSREEKWETYGRIGVWGVVIIFAVLFSALSLNRHAAFQTNGFDLGNVNQAIWNTAQGRPLAFTNMAPVENRLALHVEPILFFFVPFYWLGLGGPRLLLIVQAVGVAIGAWPLYLIARSRLGRGGGLSLALAYLLYPALEAAVLYDFHAVTLAPTFLLYAFYWLEQAIFLDLSNQALKSEASYSLSQKHSISDILHFTPWHKFILYAFLALACKEDIGLVIAMLGVYLCLKYRFWRPALLIFGLGIVWSGVAILGIQAVFGGNVQSGRYTWLIEALGQPWLIWEHLWTQADLPGYLWGMLAPTAGLALLSPLALLPTLPSLAINLLSAHGLQWRLEEFHYAASLSPFVFIAAIHGADWLRQRLNTKRQRGITPLLVSLILVASLSYHYFRGFTPLARPFQWPDISAHQRLGAAMVAKIEPDIPLFAPLTLNPHVSSRQVLHQTFDQLTPEDWLWLDIATLPNENAIQAFIRDELLPNYTPVLADDGYLLLKPGASQTNLPPSFHTYARPQQPNPPDYTVSIFFGESLELIGYDLIPNRAEEIQVRTYWRVHNQLPPGLLPTLFLLDETGHYLGATNLQQLPATLIWYPTQLWPIKAIMVVHFNTLNWYTRDRASYHLALGVTPSSDVWQVEARWRPRIANSDYAHRITRDSTVVTLAIFHQVAGFAEGGPPERIFMPPKLEQNVGAVFGDQVRLLGYNVPKQVTTADGQPAIELDLVWQGLGPTRESLVRFVHVVDAAGQLQGQQDAPPLNGLYLTSLWAEDEVVFETVIVPLQTLFDGMRLHVGLYHPVSGQRLLDGQGRDYIEIR